MVKSVGKICWLYQSLLHYVPMVIIQKWRKSSFQVFLQSLHACYSISIKQGLKFSGTMPDLTFFFKTYWYHFRVHEFAYQWYERSTAFTLNQINITSQSDFFCSYKHEMRIIVSNCRVAALMNGEARHVEKAARRNGQRCPSSTYLDRKTNKKKQWSFVNSSE